MPAIMFMSVEITYLLYLITQHFNFIILFIHIIEECKVFVLDLYEPMNKKVKVFFIG